MSAIATTWASGPVYWVFSNPAYELTVVKAEMIPDFNHDRKIDDLDENKATDSDPFRFWINDDHDITESTGEDWPEHSSPDYNDSHVNGVRDLVDFFPVYLNIKDLLTMYPSADHWYVLKQDDGAVNAIFDTGLTKATAGNFLTDSTWCQAHANAQVKSLEYGSYYLLETFLQGVKNENKAVILVEGRKATTKPLVLEILKRSENTSVFKVEMPLCISSVERMYRWINLRHVTGEGETRSTDTTVPSNNPDTLSNGKQFVFVHGYNTDERGGRGWSAEVFKRLYWSGSRAMYTAVTWQGDETPGILPTGAYYYADVINAFQAAPALASEVAALPGQKYVAAHSLGNMVVSSAMVDYGLNPVQYFMIDAAVAMESYKSTEQHLAEMVPSKWLGYSSRLWSSDWCKLFDGADGRSRLTWRGRFGNIPQAINYYSSGEEVLNNNNPPETMYIPHAEKAWVFQEQIKGGVLPAILIGVDSHGGWGFNTSYDVQVGEDEFGRPIFDTLPPDQAAQLTDAQIRAQSFFGSFYRADLYGTSGGTVAADIAVRRKILAEAIPATSRATGRNPISLTFNANIDLMGFKNGWPTSRSNGNWLHSDFKNIAYPYLYQFYEDLVTKGGLQ